MRKVIFLAAIVISCSIARASPDSAGVAGNGIKMQKSSSDAMLYSMAFPGLGQVYTENYWKVPLFAGAAGFCIYGVIANNVSFLERSRAADAAVLAGKSAVEISLTRRQREFYRDRRDLSGLFLIATYIAATIDAYADAHLFDFNVSDALTLQLAPEPARGGIMLAISW